MICVEVTPFPPMHIIAVKEPIVLLLVELALLIRYIIPILLGMQTNRYFHD